MAKVLVLGGDGFIGSHLIDDLLARGHEVSAFARFHNGRSFNLEHVRDKIEFVTGDFLNLADLERALEGVEYVFHMISLSTPASTMNDPLLDVQTNVFGTIQLLDLCVKKGVKKVIFPSSGGAIYGDTEMDLIDENHSTNPFCPYAISKLTIERYLDYFYRLHGLDYMVFRMSNPYGPRQSLSKKQGVVAVFMGRILREEPLVIWGDGNDVRDYVYVKDVTRVISDVFESDAGHRIYNLGSSEGRTVNDLIAILKELIPSSFEIQNIPRVKGHVNRVVLDSSRAKKELGFEPQVSFKEGVSKAWEHARKEH
jgi:UDP-glucose 4-epimerase